jgi:hypothetical protein
MRFFRLVVATLFLTVTPAVLAGCGGIAVLEGNGAGDSSSATSSGSSTVDPTLNCEPGWADCNGIAGDGCEVDLTSDAASCATCGHGCQGGPCQTGVCQPIVVATGQEYAYRLAATETSLYWTRSDGAVVRVHDGGEPEVIADGQNAPGDIAVNSTHVYWANVGDGTIVRAPLEGGATDLVVSGLVQPWSLAVSETRLVWTDNATGNVQTLSLAGGAEPITIATTQGAWAIALDATRVYWTSLFAGQVFAAPIAGGAPVTLSDGVISPAELALAGERVFFGTVSDAGVFAVPMAGGETTALTQKGGFGIAADGQHVYFGEYDGRLARVPLDGGEPEVLAIGNGTTADIALTSGSVYWTSASTDGVILKVAK